MENKISWKDVPQFPTAHYEVDIMWDMLERWIARFNSPIATLDLSPDYQREHVWTEAQQRAYVEYAIQGGEVGRNLIFNSPRWPMGKTELVDGKQRMEAVRKFLRDELLVFGQKCSDFATEGRSGLPLDLRFRVRVCTLKTRADALRLYLSINAGGTPHKPKELARVRALLEEESK